MRQYSEKQKHEAFLKYLCGYAPKEIADVLDIRLPTIYRWIRSWRDSLEGHTLAELPIQDIGSVLTCIAELRKQLDGLEQSIDIIHESNVLQMLPLQQRINMAMHLSGTYPVVKLCRVFEIMPSTFYYHKRIAKNGTKYQLREKLLSDAIAKAIKESRGRFGAEQIRIQLSKQGIRTSKKRIIRLMEKMEPYKRSSELPYYPLSDKECQEGICDVQIL